MNSTYPIGKRVLVNAVAYLLGWIGGAVAAATVYQTFIRLGGLFLH